MSSSSAENGSSATIVSKKAGLQGAEGYATEEAVIGLGVKITGNLECDGDIVIAGTVEGNVYSHGLAVTEGATLKGSVESSTVHVMGEIEGQINAASVHIGETGLVLGDVHYDSVRIEDGGTIDGIMRRRQSGSG